METGRVGQEFSGTLTDGQPQNTAPRNNLTTELNTQTLRAEGHDMAEARTCIAAKLVSVLILCDKCTNQDM